MAGSHSIALYWRHSRAEDKGKLDVAEHLLRALECLCGGLAQGSAAEKAYWLICDEVIFSESKQRRKRKG